LGTNLDEGFMIWNHAWYVFRRWPVMRRATSSADSPRRIGWQSKLGCATAPLGAAASIRPIVRTSPAMRKIGRNAHLIRSGLVRRVWGLTQSMCQTFRFTWFVGRRIVQQSSVAIQTHGVIP
jgi:hypothetical protein